MCRLECLRLFGGDAVDDRVDGGGVVGVVERSAATCYGLLVGVSGVGVPKGDEEVLLSLNTSWGADTAGAGLQSINTRPTLARSSPAHRVPCKSNAEGEECS